MAKFSNSLDDVRIAAPCPADWNAMHGNELVRFCSGCNLNVYNLSGMKRAEAERLIAQAEGRLCVRFYRRADGTILTDNCPVGLRAIKRRLSRMASAVASLIFSFLGGLGISAVISDRNPFINDGHGATMGAIALQRQDASPPHVESVGWTMGESVNVPLVEREEGWTAGRLIVEERRTRSRHARNTLSK